MKISSSTPCLNFAPQKEYSAAVVPHPSKNAYADYVLETGKRIPFSAADLSNLYQ
ncbi:peptidase M85, partial [Salmonella enterica]|nr:peptidase M85 [Salmonella enterica]EEI1436923.1 peptidase M85 [Salmonella enterica]